MQIDATTPPAETTHGLGELRARGPEPNVLCTAPARSEPPARPVLARRHEQRARRRYEHTLESALASLRHAERRFEATSASIDAHIESALAAAVALTGSLAAALDEQRARPRRRAVPLTAAQEMAA